jgi:hypothetical protein
MKQLMLCALMLALCATGVFAVGGAAITASVLRYEPTPAEQGNTVDIWLQLSNEGTKADRVAVKFLPEYPFSLPRGQSGEIDVGSVAATEDKVVKFTVFIDPNAPNGERNVSFLYKYSTVNEWVKLDAPLTLQTQNAVLVIDDYAITPSPVVPGQTAEVSLKIRNAGRIAVKNLDVGIDLADGTFSTIGTGTKKRVDRIDAGETETVTFQLASDTSTEVKVYGIPVSLAFQDERNKQYNETAKFSLVVSAEPELSLTVDSTDFESKTKPGTVSLKVVNKGVTNLKYVTVKLVQTEEYGVLSPSNEEYVGNLDSDDFETVDFLIRPNTAQPRLSVQVEFKDPYNADFSRKYDLPLRIITDRDLGRGGMPWGTIILVLLVAGAAGYWWLGKKKKR